MTKTTKFYQIHVPGYWFQKRKCVLSEERDINLFSRSHIFFSRKSKWKKYINNLILSLPVDVEIQASFVQSPAARQKGKPGRYCLFTDYAF